MNTTDLHPHIADAVDAVLTAREFCGSERRALKEWEDENVQLTTTERLAVSRIAAARWAQWQREARAAAANT